MTAITTLITGNTAVTRIRKATAQATGQTDWISVPPWARYGIFYFEVTAVASNGTFLPKFLVAEPITLQDSGLGTLKLAEHGAFTALTAANSLVAQVGPGTTGIADDSTNSATVVSYVSLNCVLPPVIGINVVIGGGGTVTYTISVAWRS